MKFRADIQGLRALAVLPIVAFHAGVTALPGGFTGVDIFFVISGYLITAIIEREMSDDSFSLLAFYRRRMIRILPALLAMIVVVLVTGCIVLLPSELHALSTSAAAAAGFVSNIYFWRSSGYFSALSDTLPLLHTWSLGVEEQFYLFYPFLLILLRRATPSRKRMILLAIVGLSFAASYVLRARGWDILTFYVLPSRAWELGLGGLIALGGAPRITTPALRGSLSLLGLAAITIGFVIIHYPRHFPAPWALLPCGGTALLIAYGEGSLVARLLSLPPVRWLGAISYSLYLWHWPILVFFRLQVHFIFTMVDTVSLIAVCIAAGAASYRYIERPFMARGAGAPAARMVMQGLAASLAAILLALGVGANAASWHRWDPQVRHIDAYVDYRDSAERKLQFRQGTCFYSDQARFYDRARCLGLSKTRPNILLAGNSYAAQYSRAIALKFPGDNIMQATSMGCLPIEGQPNDNQRNARLCIRLMNYVLGPFIAQGHVNAVILSGSWTDPALPALVATVRHLRAEGVRVTVIGPVNEYQVAFPQLLARSIAKHDLHWIEQFRDTERGRLDGRMRPLILGAGGNYYSAYQRECPHDHCYLFASDGAPLHFDTGHLTFSGSKNIIAALPPA